MKKLCLLLLGAMGLLSASSQTYKIYQFKESDIPEIDGNTADWNRVPDSYVLTEQLMKEDEGKYDRPDTSTLKFSVRVGWSPKTQRLYFYMKRKIIIGVLPKIH